jgi:hypothetical protein
MGSHDELHQLCREVTQQFERLPARGIARLQNDLNVAGDRGAYLIRCSATEAAHAVERSIGSGNMSHIAEHMTFKTSACEEFRRCAESVDDPKFEEAVARHDMHDTIVVCVWLYRGDPITNAQDARPREVSAARPSRGDGCRAQRADTSDAHSSGLWGVMGRDYDTHVAPPLPLDAFLRKLRAYNSFTRVHFCARYR